MRIKVNKERCSGCHLCEMVCSLFHLGVINTEKSAIRIQKDDLDSSQNIPILCHQCKEMKCLNGETGREGLERKRFIWAIERAERCPFDALTVLDENAYHCDLCGEPRNVLRFVRPKRYVSQVVEFSFLQ